MINQNQKRNLVDKVTTEEEGVDVEGVEGADFTDDDHDHEVKGQETNILPKMKGVMMKVEIQQKVKEKIEIHEEGLHPDVTDDSGEGQDVHLHKVPVMKVIVIVIIVIENIVVVTIVVVTIVMITKVMTKVDTNEMVKTEEGPRVDMDVSEEVVEEVAIEERIVTMKVSAK